MKQSIIALLVLISAISYAQSNNQETTNESEDLSKMRVFLYEEHSERPLAHSLANADGHFEFTIQRSGHYRLDLSHQDENNSDDNGLFISSEHCENKVGKIILRKEHNDEHIHHQHKDHHVHICRQN